MKMRRAPVQPRPAGLMTSWLSALLPAECRPGLPAILLPTGEVVGQGEVEAPAGVILLLEATPAGALLWWQALMGDPALISGWGPTLRWGATTVEGPPSSEPVVNEAMNLGEHLARHQGWWVNMRGVKPDPDPQAVRLNWRFLMRTLWAATPASIEAWSPALLGDLSQEEVPLGDLGRLRRPLQEQGVTCQEHALELLQGMLR